MILTSGELLEFMESVPPEEWPAPSRGYGYGAEYGQRLKSWHIAVVRKLLQRMDATTEDQTGETDVPPALRCEMCAGKLVEEWELVSGVCDRCEDEEAERGE